eukprot:CAMPEP_0117063610 /NCGR_PEP_ID=MMETSP0472-20121206/44406_1 /TAXON_ID=693140 ORGANISM="Tiarina fusus, Strain LIS" /NCGR_SAMPLE_ID=MMETSP0472 /ASSEMBLY_ACC=CAM_ASM_000603 /LENGTH=243 /DNA_ID=CAMNT_0004783383 /DNA_START=127 /DNA_END=855 /DNA_ORIENTATION=+
MSVNDYYTQGYGRMLEPTPVSDIVQQQHLRYQHQHLVMLRERLQQEQQRLAAEMNYFENVGGTKRRRGQRVGFAQEVLVYNNPRELEEVQFSWYSKEQLGNFKDDRKAVIRALKKVNFDLSQIDTTVHQLRGLEAYLSISFNKMMQRKRTEVVHTVLKEQNHQRSNGLYDVEAIRNSSCQVTDWARLRGLELARQDASDSASAAAVACDSASAAVTSSSMEAWGHDSNVSQTPSLCSTETASS